MLAVTAVADTFANARARAYRAVDQIDFADGFHRRDIGWRELERAGVTCRPMSLLWDLYWPVIVAAAVAGVMAGAFGFRRKKRGRFSLAAGIAATIAVRLDLAWASRHRRPVRIHGRTPDPPGARGLGNGPVRAIVARDPLQRTLILSGPADDFQRAELVRILNYVPGVGNVRWANAAE